jgi:hypothetical protein
MGACVAWRLTAPWVAAHPRADHTWHPKGGQVIAADRLARQRRDAGVLWTTATPSAGGCGHGSSRRGVGWWGRAVMELERPGGRRPVCSASHSWSSADQWTQNVSARTARRGTAPRGLRRRRRCRRARGRHPRPRRAAPTRSRSRPPALRRRQRRRRRRRWWSWRASVVRVRSRLTEPVHNPSSLTLECGPARRPGHREPAGPCPAPASRRGAGDVRPGRARARSLWRQVVGPRRLHPA